MPYSYSTFVEEYKGARINRTNGLIKKYYVVCFSPIYADIRKNFYRLQSARDYVDKLLEISRAK